MDEENLAKVMEKLESFIESSQSSMSAEEEIKAYGYRQRKTDRVEEAIEAFFEQDIEEIVKIEEIWAALQEDVKSEIAWITGDWRHFNNNMDFKLDDFTTKWLESLSEQLTNYAEKRYDKIWSGWTVEEAKRELSKGQIYVALLGKDKKLTREPFALTTDLTTDFSYRIEEVKTRQGRRREIGISFSKPVKAGDIQYAKRGIRLRDNEVEAAKIVVR